MTRSQFDRSVGSWVVLCLCALLTAGRSAFAATTAINIHFATGRGGAVRTLSGTAGVEPYSTWNNVTGLTGSNVALTDSNGAATSALLTFTGAPDNWDVYNGNGATNDAQLINSYLDTSGGSNTVTVTISNVPFPYYHVYGYFNSDGAARQGHITLGTTSYYFASFGNVAFPGYVQATATATTATKANYALFTSLSGAGGTLTIQFVRGNNNVGLTGIQIVADPPTAAWTGASDTTWSNGANWNTGVPPGGTTGTASPDTAIFNSNPTNQAPVVDAGRNLTNIKFDGNTGGLTLAGSALLMTNGGVIQILSSYTGTGQTQAVNAPLKIEGATLTLTNNAPNGGSLLNFGGGISGDSPVAATLNLLGTNTGANTVSGVIANGNATQVILNKNNAGLWIFTAPNTYSGATTIAAGTLQLGDGTTGHDGSIASASITNNGTLVVNNFGAVTIGGAIGGTGVLTKTSVGVLTLSAGNTYSGATTINGGVLSDTALISGAVTVGGIGATGTPTLSGNGNVSGAVNVSSANGGAAGHVAPGVNTAGNSGGIGTLNTGAMAIGAGAALDFDLGTPGTGVPSTGNAGDLIAINGNLTLPTSGTITVNLYDNANAGGNGSIGAGTYKLFTFTGQTFNFSSASSFTIGNTPLAGKFYIFSLIGNEIDLTIANGVSNLTWNGAASSIWNTSAANWFNTDNSTTTNYIDNLSIITFQDVKLPGATNVTNNAISIPSPVAPISVTFNNAAVPYTFSATTAGIGGTGGITLTGTGTVTLQSPNAYTGQTVLNAGVLKIKDNADIGAANGTIAPLVFNGGALSYLPAATNPDVSGRTVTMSLGGATIDTNGQTVTYGAAIGNGGPGGLTLADTNATPGTLILGVPVTYTGDTTVTSGTLQLGNGATDATLLGNTVNNSALVFNVSSSAAYNKVISGTGSLTKNGAGTLTLGGTNTYGGVTNINAGTITARNNSALGTALAVLNSGTLQLAGDGAKVGINFSDGRNGTEIENVTGTAGVVPMGNWNNVATLTGTNVALNDANGNASPMLLTFSGSTDPYSTYGAPQASQDGQLINSYLDTNVLAAVNTITLSSIPYSNYRVYVYVNSDTAGRTGHVSIGATTYYFSTVGNAAAFAGYTQGTATTLGAAAAANYVLFDNLSGSTVTITQQHDSGNNGICGIEVVSIGMALPNNVSVTQNSTIDVTGVSFGSVGSAGALAMGAQTLTATGGSLGAGLPYTLTLGAATFSGDPTFIVMNNGGGLATLNLGSLSDGGVSRIITLSGTGAVTLTQPAAGFVAGPVVNATGGTLNSNNATALGTTARVTVALGATFGVGASQTISSLTPSANAGNVILQANSTLTIGSTDNLASDFAGVISGTGGLVKAGTNTLTLSAANTYSGPTTVNSGILMVTGSITGTPTSGAVTVGGAAASGTPTLAGAANVSGAVTISSANGGAAGHLAPGVNTTGNSGAIGMLNTGPLSLNANSVLDFDFGTPGTGIPSTGSFNDLVAIAGDLTFPSTGTVTLNLTDNAAAGGNGSIGTGTYKLFSFTGQAFNFSPTGSIVIGTTPLAGKSYIFTTIGNEIDLTITSGVQDMAWTGQTNGLWNTSAVNWYSTTASAATNYVDNLSHVSFQDVKLPGAANVTNNAITIQSGGVSPLSVIFTNAAVPYTFSNASGVIGIAGTTSFVLNGSGTVILQSPNTYIGATQLNAGILQIKDNAALGSMSGTIAPLTFNGGTLSYVASATNTDISGRVVTINAGGATFDPNGQTITYGSGIGANGAGALTLNDSNATPGILVLTGANSYTGGSTIAAGTLQLGDGTIDGTVPGNIADNAALIYNVASLNANGGVISGSGSVSKDGPGVLNFANTNTYTGVTNVNAGTVSVKTTGALSTSTVDLNGGTLQLAASENAMIGIHFSTGRANVGDIDNVTGTAGVVPMQNWNNVPGITGANVALVDGNGAASPANVTFTGSPNTYSVYGASQTNQDAQLMNSYIDNNATSTITVTVANIPYARFRAIVYVGSDGNGRIGHVTVGSTTYYFTTNINPFASYIQATATTAAASAAANYALFDDLSGPTLTIVQAREATSNNNGICGIQIISESEDLSNNVVINANSTIDVTGTDGGTLGLLSMGSHTLAVTGGATAANLSYGLNLGAATFSGNPTFNVANNGSGAGILALGALNDGGVVRTITLTGSGTLTLAASSAALSTGTKAVVNGGILNSNSSTALGVATQVSVAAGAVFNLGASQTISQLLPAANGGSVNLGANALTIGSLDNLSSNFSGVISGTGSILTGGTGSLTLSGANTYSGATTVNTGTLVVTGSIIGAPSSGAVTAGGVNAIGNPTLSGTGTLGGATSINAGNGGANGHLAPGVNPGANNSGGIGTLTTGTLTLGAGAILDFDFGTPGTGLPAAGSNGDVVAVNGDVVLPTVGSGSVVINLNDNANAGGNGALGVGTYKLITFTGTLFNFDAGSSFTVGNTPLAGKSYFFSQVGNEIDLTVSSGASSLTWTGATNSLWDTASTNWYNTTTAAPAKFADNNLSLVTFQDAMLGGAGNVTNSNISIQAAGVRPILVNFNNTLGGVAYTFSNASGVIGISGSTGLQLSGSGTVTLQSANSYTGATTLNGGTLIIGDNAHLGSTAAGSVAPLSFSGGTLRYATGASNMDVSGRTFTIGVGGAAIDTNGQTVTYANPIGNGGVGRLTLGDTNVTPGKLILSAANTYTGGTTVNAGTLQIGDGTVDGSIIGSITDNGALIYNIVGSNTTTGAISGTGTLTKNGAGTLILNANNSFNGGSTLNAGVVSARTQTALGSGQINLNGSTLQLASGTIAGCIGINFAAGRTTEIENVTGVAGVVPIANWNNIQTIAGTNVALTDSSGSAISTTLTFSGAPVSYSVYGVAQANQDAQLMNSYLDTNANAGNTTNTITITNIPYANYRVYVYVQSDGGGRQGHVTVGATTYYFNTIGNGAPFARYVQTTATTTATIPAANYALFDNLTGSTLTISQVRDTNNCGVNAVEIVSLDNLVNNVAVNANSVIDVSGICVATLGTLSMGSQKLSITGGTPASNTLYSLTFGATTINGNPTINVANSGTGIGTLALGALSDGGTLRTITLNAGGTTGGTLFLGGSTGGLSDGTKMSVAGGTLRLGAPIVLGSAPAITLSAAGTLDGNGQSLSGDLRGSGTVTGSLKLNVTNVWPGTTSIVTTPMAADESMNLSPTGNIDFSSDGKLKAIVTVNAGTINKQFLNVAAGGTVTLGGTSVLSLGVGPGAYAGTAPNGGADIPIIAGATGSSVMTSGFATVIGLQSGWAVVYKFNGSDLASAPSAGSPADTLVVRTTASNVTPVTLEAFAARAEGGGVLVTWNSVSEFQNAGFNVYRRNSKFKIQDSKLADAWTRANSTLIAGRITNPDLKAYCFYDWAAPGIYDYKLESVSIRGFTETHSTLAGPVAVDENGVVSGDGLHAALESVALAGANARGKELSAEFAKVERSSRSVQADATQNFGATENRTEWELRSTAERLRAAGLFVDASGQLAMSASVRALTPTQYDGLLALGDDPRAQQQGAGYRSLAPAPTPAPASNLSAGVRWFSSAPARGGSFAGVKVVYDTPGVLLIPSSALPAGFDAGHVSIQREGRALNALALSPSGLIVYGQGYADDYTNKDALFLRRTNAATSAGQIAHAQGLFASAQSVNTTSPAMATVSYHDVYFDFDNLRPYDYAPWFSNQYLSGGTTQSFTLNTPNASGGPASLTVNLWSLTQASGTANDHALQAFINGQPAGQAVWSGGGTMVQLAFQLAPGILVDGANTIELVTPQLDGVATQIALLHSMTASYTKALNGAAPLEIYNPSGASQLFEAQHLPSADAWVVDARFPDRATLIPYETQAQNDGTFALRFNAPSGGTGQFLIVPAGMENKPIAVSKRAVKPLAAFTYLAIGPSQFSAGAQALLAQRSKEGLRGSFADQEQIFDYYNYGRYGPNGIQNAVRAVRPKYLLLLGRTTYDYLDYSGLNVDPLCPTFLVSTTFWSQATSDSMFGDLGRGYPEVVVGRLPVNTPSELSVAVSRILSNKGMTTGARVHAVADEADPIAGDFAAEADSIAAANPELAWQRNYLGVTAQSSPDVTAALTQAANGGADILFYVGHGNAVRLGKNDPRILETDSTADTVQNLTGNAVFLQATCTGNWMAKNETGYRSIAIQALTQPQGGISASIGTSTYMQSEYAVAFMSRLLQNASAGGRWGDALMKTQQWAYSQGGSFYGDLSRTEQIFGDPAMPVMGKGNATTVTTPGAGQF
ncbi:MAG TPA: autotransporter-associated beta strand repeat-containing protein [Planctomycetota bacterium]|nr:autotransporter-associated beta strand repeat-containing protein [Planctomycetota bacterium]